MQKASCRQNFPLVNCQSFGRPKTPSSFIRMSAGHDVISLLPDWNWLCQLDLTSSYRLWSLFFSWARRWTSRDPVLFGVRLGFIHKHKSTEEIMPSSHAATAFQCGGQRPAELIQEVFNRRQADTDSTRLPAELLSQTCYIATCKWLEDSSIKMLTSIRKTTSLTTAMSRTSGHMPHAQG